MVCVELGREIDEDIVSVRSEGATTVDAMDMVLACGTLP
jgi:hypothetical protein